MNGVSGPEAWSTDELLASAAQRYAASITGFEFPVAFGLGRFDGDRLCLAHVNKIGAVRRLPAAVLASVCGYRNVTGTFALSAQDIREVLARLAPAEAATHIPHPNLWTWREILAGGQPSSTYYAYFLANVADRITGPGAAEFASAAQIPEQRQGGSQ